MKKCLLIFFVLSMPLLVFSQVSEITVKNDKVGVNIESPTKQFHIEGYPFVNTNVLYSKVNFVGGFDVRAIEGYSIPNPGYGLGGHFTGGYKGVYAFNDGQEYNGIETYGLHARSEGSTGTRIGLFSEAVGGITNLAAKFGSGDVVVENDIRIGTTAQNGKLHIVNTNEAFGSTASVIRVEGDHNGTQATYGMYATMESSSSGDAAGIRVQGNVTGSGNSYGVRALAYANGSGGVAYGLHTQVSDAQGWSLYSLGKNYMSGDLRLGTLADPYSGAYKLIVDGKILSEEVRIQNSSAWPDYVFDESYDLMPLEELAQNIKENGHLPNIPPAAVVESEGIQVGDMQIRMMEKIEELTLYILQQQKEIELLKTLIERN